MIEPLPRWAKGFAALMGLAVLAIVVWQILDDGLGDPQPADWRVEPTAQLGPASQLVPIVVNERACSSGRSAEGRITTDVDYEPEVVRIDVRVRPVGGDVECPSNPDTRLVLTLDEPLGDRTIVGERWGEP